MDDIYKYIEECNPKKLKNINLISQYDWFYA